MTERGSRLPGVEREGDERIVLHVDMDCFYAACERLRESELRGEPIVVGMGYEDGESHGAVATASYEAREFGVESAQAISAALERLPRRESADSDGGGDSEGDDVSDSGGDGEGDDGEANAEGTGYYRPVDMEFYQSVSEDVRDVLHDSAGTVREVSIDEAYLDVTERTAWEVAEGFARHVKNRIEREVGVTASIGVAPNMSCAKIASDYDKPDGLVVVEPGEVREFLAPLDVEEVHGVGPVTARELREMGVETAGDLADADPTALDGAFGGRGRDLHRRARGDDEREVTPTGRPKSLSRESAFTEATRDFGDKRERVVSLAGAVCDRARGKDAMYRTIGIKVVTTPYDVHTRERSLSGPVDDPALVEDVALDLLPEFADDPVRKVGVRVSNLQFTDADQASLDGFDAPDSGASNPEATEDGGVEGETAEEGAPSGTDAEDESSGADAETGTEGETAEEDEPSGETTTEAESSPAGDDSASSGQASLSEF